MVIYNGNPTIIIGTIAERPSAASITADGTIYHAKDTSATYMRVTLGGVKIWQSMAAAGSGFPLTSDVSAGGFRITDLGNPINPGDAANKAYVDAVAAGLDVKPSVAIATAGTPLSTLSPYGVVGNVMTETALGAFPAIDGITLTSASPNPTFLLKEEGNPINNGIWRLTTTGDGGTSWVAERIAELVDGDSASGSFTFVEEGGVNIGSGWVCISPPGTDVVGTDAMTWTQFSGAGEITAGPGLTKSGNTLSLQNPNTVAVTWTAMQTFQNDLSLDMPNGVVNLVGTDAVVVGENGTGISLVSGAGAPADAATAGGSGGDLGLLGNAGGAGSALQLSGAGGFVALIGGDAGASGGAGRGAAGDAQVDAGRSTINGTVFIGDSFAAFLVFGNAASVTTYNGGTNVPDTAKGISFTASKLVSRYRLTATGLTVTLSSTDPDGTTYEIWNTTKSATPNVTFTPNGGLKINIAGSYTQASININTDFIARTITKMNGEWWIAS